MQLHAVKTSKRVRRETSRKVKYTYVRSDYRLARRVSVVASQIKTFVPAQYRTRSLVVSVRMNLTSEATGRDADTHTE